MQLEESKAAERGTMHRGRQIVFMIMLHFKTNQSLDLVYSIEDLNRLDRLGNKEMHTFRHDWNQYISQMKDIVGDNAHEHSC